MATYEAEQDVKRPEKQEEIWAEQYLKYCGFSDIQYEPFGKRTPDFLVDKRIAVEVRRLNQQRWTGTGTLEALDKLGQPFIRNLLNLLESFGSPVHGVSWFVSCEFKRPQVTETWKPLLQQKLKRVDDTQLGEQIIPIDENLSFTLTRADKALKQRFEMGWEDDKDIGGWAVPEFEQSLNLCISEKEAKIAPYRNEYPEWWLILVDFMMVGQKKPVRVTHSFEKLIVIHPGNYADAYEIPSVYP